jgi:hypothetical protein
VLGWRRGVKLRVMIGLADTWHSDFSFWREFFNFDGFIDEKRRTSDGGAATRNVNFSSDKVNVYIYESQIP